MRHTLIALLLVGVLCSYNISSADENKAPKFSNIPFVLSGNKIPQDYLGHDLRDVYDVLKVRLKKQKDEFETTAEFNERIERENKLPLIGSINMADNFALLVKVESTYNADNKTLKISLPVGRLYGGPLNFCIKSQEKSLHRSEYVGSNIFGATAKVTKYYENNTVLFSNNTGLYDILKHFTLSDVSIEDAKNFKGNLSTIFVFKLDYPLIGEEYFHKKATIDRPNEFSNSYNIVYCTITEIIIFDNTSGEILRRIAIIDNHEKTLSYRI